MKNIRLAYAILIAFRVEYIMVPSFGISKVGYGQNATYYYMFNVGFSSKKHYVYLTFYSVHVSFICCQCQCQPLSYE